MSKLKLKSKPSARAKVRAFRATLAELPTMADVICNGTADPGFVGNVLVAASPKGRAIVDGIYANAKRRDGQSILARVEGQAFATVHDGSPILIGWRKPTLPDLPPDWQEFCLTFGDHIKAGLDFGVEHLLDMVPLEEWSSDQYGFALARLVYHNGGDPALFTQEGNVQIFRHERGVN
jgi:hypothetical protein